MDDSVCRLSSVFGVHPLCLTLMLRHVIAVEEVYICIQAHMHAEETRRDSSKPASEKIPNRLSFFIFNLFLLKKSIRIDISKIRSPAHSQDDCDIRRAHNINTFHIEHTHRHRQTMRSFLYNCAHRCVYILTAIISM